MSKVFGIPLIAFIQMVLGTAVVLFVLIKYLSRPRKPKGGEYIISNVHVLVGDGTEKHDQHVHIQNGVIREISDKPLQKKSIQIIDGRGKTLMPGLIDSHIHIQGGFSCHNEEESDAFLNEKMPQIFAESILPFGITTIKDMDAPKHFICKLRDKIRSGEIPGPELFIVGPNFTAPDGHPASTLGSNSKWAREEMAIEVTTPEQVSAGIQELKAMGIDFLKFTYQGGDYWYFDKKLTIRKMDKALMQQLIREGKENGLKATAHVFYYDDVKELLEAGIYGIEHGILDRDITADDPIVKLWKESGARFVPTVNAMTYEKDPARMAHSKHNLKVLYDAGIPIAMGTDNMLEMMTGATEHRELAYYVEAGLTPMQAITLATKNGAEHLGIADRKGLVKAGMQADLILLDQNPAENISNISLINKVFLNGKVVYSPTPIQSYDIPVYEYPENLKAVEYVSTDGQESRTVSFARYADERIITQTNSRNGEKWSEEEFLVEPNLSAVTWQYLRPSDNTNLRAERKNGIIRISGTFKGKPQDKNFSIAEGLWYQMMDLSIPAFVHSGLEEILLYSIGTGDNRGAMGLGEFLAKKVGSETVSINGREYHCTKVSFALTAFTWAWTGLFWYDQETGQLVQSGTQKGKNETILWQVKEFIFS